MVKTDLPVAVFCSGGIDSGIILYEAARSHRNVTAFTIGVAESSPDVLAARRLAGDLGVPFEYVHCTEEELLASIPSVIHCIESFEPNHIRGGTLSYALSRAVHRAGFRVALCGEGADELFCGYPEFLLCLSKPDPELSIRGEVSRFVDELARTQLQRVDRTSMAWQVEVRVPYLSARVADLALALPGSLKLRRGEDGRTTNKWVLRQAYREHLPEWVVNRPKQVLSEGAGVGDNSQAGLFFEHAQSSASLEALKRVAAAAPSFHISTLEEAYYFGIFRDLFGEITFAADRPHVNTLPT